MLADMTARAQARAGQFDPIREVVGNDFRASQGTQAGVGNQDFIDNRDPNKAYTMDMISYIDPSTGEVTSRTSGIEPAPGSRFVRYYGPSPQGLGGGQQSTNPMDGYMPANPNAMAAYNQFLQRGQAMAGMYANQPAVTPTPSQMQAGSKSPQFSAQNYGMAGQIPPPPGGGLGSRDIYNQLMQQQMAMYPLRNQDAATNFGNMEPGQYATQPAKTSTPMPQVPIAGIGMQQIAPQKQQRNTLSQGSRNLEYF